MNRMGTSLTFRARGLAGLALMLVFFLTAALSPVNSASSTRGELAVAMLQSVGDDVDAGGRKIRQLDGKTRADLSVCFKAAFDNASQAFNRDWDRCRNNPRHKDPVCSQWTGVVQVTFVSYQYAAGTPNVELSPFYTQIKQLQIIGKGQQETACSILRQMGMDCEQLRQIGTAAVRDQLRLIISASCPQLP